MKVNQSLTALKRRRIMLPLFLNKAILRESRSQLYLCTHTQIYVYIWLYIYACARTSLKTNMIATQQQINRALQEKHRREDNNKNKMADFVIIRFLPYKCCGHLFYFGQVSFFGGRKHSTDRLCSTQPVDFGPELYLTASPANNRLHLLASAAKEGKFNRRKKELVATQLK